MADTLAATGLRAQIWDDKFWTEYLTENRFTESMGSDENAIIQVKEDLNKGTGDSITIALVNKLTNQAVTGSNMLEGYEEDMSSRSQRIYIDKRRNAVRIAEMEEYKSAIDLRDAARATLKDWSMKDTEKLTVDQMLSIDGVRYEDASVGNRDTWLRNNFDRVLFGALVSNAGAVQATATYAAAINTVDNTADKLTPQAVSLMKERALLCNPKITPIRVEKTNGRRYYVLYVNTRAMRDLKTNSSMMQAQREVTLEVENNRLFKGGDLLWDGVVVKEVPEIGFYQGSGIQVSPVFFCGAQAVAIAYGKRWSTMTKSFDYGDKYGVGIEAIYGVRKIQFGTGTTDTDTLKDNGIVTGWFAAEPSA